MPTRRATWMQLALALACGACLGGGTVGGAGVEEEDPGGAGGSTAPARPAGGAAGPRSPGGDAADPRGAPDAAAAPDARAGASADGAGGATGPSADASGARDGQADVAPPPELPLFDQSRIHQIELTMAVTDWQTLRDHFRENTYYKADVSLDGEVVRQIGVRSRGWGSRSASKPGLKLDFNEYVSSQEYRGYKDVVLDNMWQDPTLLNERLVFAVFEAMGIPAPRSAFARLIVNGQYWGLYAVVEPISKPFLRARLGNNSGTLYDFECTDICYNFTYLGEDPKKYIPIPFDPQTNENTLDAGRLIGFIRTANQAPDATFLADVSSYFEVAHFLTYLAVENAVADKDGWLGDWYSNNFNLYQNAATDRFVILPWDKDYVFKQADMSIWNRVDKNVLAKRLLAIPSQRALYLAALDKAMKSFVNPRWLTPKVDAFYKLIRPAVLEDTHKPITNQVFESSVAALRTFIGAREASVLKQLATAM